MSFLDYSTCLLESKVQEENLWPEKHLLKNLKKIPNFLLESITVVLIAEDQGVILENLGFAVFVLGNLLLKARFQALQKPAGKNY
jgi:hypothetical protein